MDSDLNSPGLPLPAVTVARVLENFSGQLLGLHALARQGDTSWFMHTALSEFRSLVPFASGWWGECSDQSESTPPMNW